MTQNITGKNTFSPITKLFVAIFFPFFFLSFVKPQTHAQQERRDENCRDLTMNDDDQREREREVEFSTELEFQTEPNKWNRKSHVLH